MTSRFAAATLLSLVILSPALADDVVPAAEPQQAEPQRTEPDAEDAAGPRAHAPEPLKKFGDVTRGTELVHSFEIRNVGTEALEIRGVKPSCECTVTDYDKVIPPGGSGKVNIHMDTTQLDGPGNTTIQVATNDPNNRIVTFGVEANVVSFLRANPGLARWVTTQGEPEGTIAQTFYSIDGADFRVLSVSSPIAAIKATTRAATPEEREKDRTGAQYRLETTLDSWAPVGTIAGHVVVHTDHPRQPDLYVPVSGFVRPVVHIAPATGDFGEIRLDSPKKSDYHLKSFTREPLAVTAVDIDVPGLTATIDPIEEGREYWIHLVFGKEMAAGDFEGTMTIRTDSTKKPTIEVPLTGTVVPATSQSASATPGAAQ